LQGHAADDASRTHRRGLRCTLDAWAAEWDRYISGDPDGGGFMLIPWNTDAPIYHWPYATVGLIVVNVLAFIVVVEAGEEAMIDWSLWHGDGLHPLQWVTSNFIHGGIMHLVGNMFFLWGFGLVIEGKLGWLRFLGVFFGIGIVQCAMEQVISLGMEEGMSLGASAIIFGLLAMAWAPKNEMSCVLLIGFRVVMLEISILIFALLYLAWQVVMLCIEVFAFEQPLGTAALHLMGAFLGLIVGVVMLKKEWVDCENWDVFALWNDRLGEKPEERKAKKEPVAADLPPEVAAAQRETQRENALRTFREMIATGNLDAAQAHLHKARAAVPNAGLAEKDLLDLIKALHEQRRWSDSLPWMVECMRQFPEKAVRMRLKLAQILVDELERPGQALDVLRKLPLRALPDELEQTRAKLVEQAVRMQESSTAFEVGLEDW
jgi:membrane associated rhomboid family serine protease